MSTPSVLISQSVQQLPLERPHSVRKTLPELAKGWLLDTYVIGPENEPLGHLFEHSTIRNLGSISPVLFYGEKGLGKTALAITLAVRWSRLLKERPVCFMTGNDFCQQYAASVEIDDIASFRTKVRGSRLLVVDGLDPLGEKPAAQLELAASIDSLVSEGHPVIATASALPLAPSGFLPYLTSRLSSGLSIPMAKPEAVTRSALIGLLVAKLNPKLPVSDLVRLADDLSNDHTLALSQLSKMVLLANQNVLPTGGLDLFVLRSLMRQLLVDDCPDISTISKSICRRMMVKLADVRSDSRVANIVRARGLAILLARKLTTLSLQQIGSYFGGRDHSTVLNAIRRTNLMLADDPVLSNCCRDVEAELLRK